MCRSPNHSALSAISVICCTGQCPVIPPPTKLLYSPLGSLTDVKCVESEFGVTSRSHCPVGAVPGGSVVTAVGEPGTAGRGAVGVVGVVGCCATSEAAGSTHEATIVRRLRPAARISDADPEATMDPARSARASPGC